MRDKGPKKPKKKSNEYSSEYKHRKQKDIEQDLIQDEEFNNGDSLEDPDLEEILKQRGKSENDRN